MGTALNKTQTNGRASMAARAALVGSIRARSLGRPAASASLLRSFTPVSTTTSSLAFTAAAFSRSYATASSGPSRPITSQGTPRASNPADPIKGTSLPSQLEHAQRVDHPNLATVAASSPSFSPSRPVDGLTASSALSKPGGETGPGPNGDGSGAPPKIVIEKVKRGRARRWVVRFARTVLFIVVAGAGYIGYDAYRNRHPPDQLPHDPTKKNLVILGNGWASTSLLKNLDTEGYNVTVISPRNYFLFTPLLPSVTVGTLESRSIIEPTRFITRHKARAVDFFEGEATDIDVANRTVTFADNSDMKAEVQSMTIPYDYLVVNVGAANQTFGIKGVEENACFLKETWDAEKIRTRLMDCVETATFKGQTEEEIRRLLHMVVVGGGPTGVEYAAELHDFLTEDLQNWYPEIAGKVKITLVEALPNVLPMFSKQLIDYTSETFKANDIDVLTRTMVKEVKPKSIIAQDEKKNVVDIPYGLLVWATGNTARPLTKKIISQIGSEIQNQRRGLVVDEKLKVAGTEGVWACGDSTATNYAPTAQVASQQGKYLARVFNQLGKREELEFAMEEARASQSVDVEQLVKQYNRVATIRPFAYSHQGSLAYIGSDKAIADLPFFNGNLASGGAATFLFWRSAYISTLFSLRNRSLVVLDWIKVKVFGRDVSRE